MKRLYIFYLIGLLLNCSAIFSQTSTGLKINHLSGDFYIYTTYKNLNGAPFPSNSMYLVTTNGIVLFDTPWDSLQFQSLLDSIEMKHHLQVVLCISTHFHADRTAGLAYYNALGIATYSSKQTFDLCAVRNEKQSAHYFLNDTMFVVGNHTFSTYYPGAGHSPDNIVIWFEDEKVLYGGCFIKSMEVNNLGNLGDADIDAWKIAIDKVRKKFPSAIFIIPGHFGWGDDKSLDHTAKLLKKAKN
jgi:glyoxylase-like metal-dependent hydrolase (beta-lactamase superfamily II)